VIVVIGSQAHVPSLAVAEVYQRIRRTSPPAGCPAGGAQSSAVSSGCGQPQHFSRPSAESIDSTPSTGLSVISVTPVSKKSRPGVFSGLAPESAQALIASIPLEAISSGYCCEVAPITPSLTFSTPGQPPSTETIRTSSCLPKDFSAS